MRICFFSGDVTRNGGTERVSVTVANELAKDERFQISFLSLVEQRKDPHYEIAPSITRHALGRKWLSPGPAYLPLIPKLRRFLKEEKIDLIIDIDIVLDVLSVPASRGLKTKVISWEHSNCQYELTQGWYRRIILDNFTKKTDCVVTLTPGDAKAFQEHFQRKERILSIYNPAAVTKVPVSAERENWLITASRLVPEKGTEYLAIVAKEVLKAHPNWKWMICGEGPERKALEDFREREGLQEQLVLLGYVPLVEGYLAKAKIFVLTSKAEGLPMCLLEARAMGVPCVSFDVPTGPADLIEDGVNGYLIPAFECGEMAKRLGELMEDPDRLSGMARRAGEGLEPFELSEVTGQWKKLCEDLLE